MTMIETFEPLAFPEKVVTVLLVKRMTFVETQVFGTTQAITIVVAVLEC